MIVNFLPCNEVPSDYCVDFDPMISHDDVPLVLALEARGAEVRAADWQLGRPADLAGDLTFIRSCWNYHHSPDACRTWIEEAAGFFGEPLYAHVDGLVIDGVFTLMELELIEPELFFVGNETAADRLAKLVYTRFWSLSFRERVGGETGRMRGDVSSHSVGYGIAPHPPLCDTFSRGEKDSFPNQSLFGLMRYFSPVACLP